MMKKIRTLKLQTLKRWTLYSIIALCLILTACSKVTQKNFDKVHLGMSKKEVVVILGEPTSTEDIAIAGIGGMSAQWKTREIEVDIQFLNDIVAVKSFSKIADKKQKEKTPSETT